MPPVWRRWFQTLFARVGGSPDTVFASVASPTFTGTPSAPTAAVGTASTQLATTAFVLGQAASSAPAMDGSAAVGASTRYARSDHVHPTDTSRAPLASPAFTGTPTAPTPTAGDSSTKIATTAFLAPPAWTAPTLLNSWVNYGAGGYSDAGYYKDAAGTVRLQGAIKSGTIGASVFTLPAGSRPLAAQAYAVPTGAGLATYGAVTVAADGTVTVTVGSNALVHLAGVSFRAEQ
jgi:hypothetical protein